MSTRLVYIRQSLASGEELIHIGDFHWMYTLSAVMKIVYGLIFCIGIMWAGVYFEQNWGGGLHVSGVLDTIRAVHPGIKLVAFLAFVMGLLGFAQMMIIKYSTEIAVTSTRLVYKRGLVARHVGEMSIDRIEGVNVLQSVLGRILGYGRVMVRGMGVGEVVLPPLRDPIKFRRAIEKARMS